MSFDPSRHMMNLKGKDYLPVAARIAWFREEHPDWGIVTEPHELGENWAIFRTSIFNAEGRLIATATKREDRAGFPDFLEKAETGSCGRALALCGYGTLQAQEFDETPRIVDSPQPAPAPRQNGNGQRANIATASAPAPDLIAAKRAWVDMCGEASIDDARARGEMLNVLLSRPRDSREPVTADGYRQAAELLNAEGIPDGFFNVAPETESVLGEEPGAMFGPDEGVTPRPAANTSAIAAGL